MFFPLLTEVEYNVNPITGFLCIRFQVINFNNKLVCIHLSENEKYIIQLSFYLIILKKT